MRSAGLHGEQGGRWSESSSSLPAALSCRRLRFSQSGRGLRSRGYVIPLSLMLSITLAKPPNSEPTLDLQSATLQSNRVRTMTWPILGAVHFFLALVVAAAHLPLYAASNSKVLVLQYFSGLAAVLGFLVISGYSIAASFAKQRDGLYVRRALRILPLYTVMIVLIALLPDINKAFGPPNRGQLLGNLFLLQGIFLFCNPVNSTSLSTHLDDYYVYLGCSMWRRSFLESAVS